MIRVLFMTMIRVSFITLNKSFSHGVMFSDNHGPGHFPLTLSLPISLDLAVFRLLTVYSTLCKDFIRLMFSNVTRFPVILSRRVSQSLSLEDAGAFSSYYYYYLPPKRACIDRYTNAYYVYNRFGYFSVKTTIVSNYTIPIFVFRFRLCTRNTRTMIS